MAINFHTMILRAVNIKVLFFFVIVLVSRPVLCENSAHAKILVLMSTASNASIEFYTQDELIGRRIGTGVGGAFGLIGLGVGAAASHFNSNARNEEYSNRFAQIIDSHRNKKRIILEAGLSDVFNRWHDIFKIVVPTRQESAPYILASGKVDLNEIKKHGYHYLLVLKENLLYQTPVENPGELAPDFSFSIYLWNANRSKPDTLDDVRVRLDVLRELEEVLGNQNVFYEDYAASIDNLGRDLYKQLEEEDRLHVISDAYGLGDEFPSIEELRDQYEGKFSYRFTVPDDWDLHEENKYVYNLGPEEHRKIVSVTTTIELDRLTQLYSSDRKKEFVRFYFRDLVDKGWTISDATNTNVLDITNGWNTATIVSPVAGKIVFMYRMIGDIFLLSHSIEVVSGNADVFLGHYKKGIEEYINSSSLILEDH